MVFRKPYAFLIKNFRKIHVLMLFFWGFIFYKMFLAKDFVKEFIELGTYNSSLENISSKFNAIFYLVVVLMIIVSIALLALLRYKKKPWKLYLVIVCEYIFMIYSCVSLTTFFKEYDPINPVSSIYFNRDIFNIASWVQYAVLIVLLLRITGLDLKKFGFNTDKEFLELNSADREEFEVNIEFDKHSISRKYNKIKRNLSYFYEEHKFMVRLVTIVLVLSLVGYGYYYFAIKNKSYKEGQVFNMGRYDVQVIGTYVTDKDDLGEEIEEKSKFIILKVKMKNNYDDRVEVDFSRLHLMNTSKDFINTAYYDDYFKDVGNLASQDNHLNGGQIKEFNLIYKVPKELDNNKFVLYCQEYHGVNDTYLRKVKLSVEGISNVQNEKVYNIGEKVVFETLEDKYDVIFDEVSFVPNTTYSSYECIEGEECKFKMLDLSATPGKKILKIVFASSQFEGKEFIDFSCKYGKIKYVDNNGTVQYYNLTNLIKKDYEGKEVFIDVTDQIVDSKEVYLDYLIRDKKYSIKIK